MRPVPMQRRQAGVSSPMGSIGTVCTHLSFKMLVRGELKRTDETEGFSGELTCGAGAVLMRRPRNWLCRHKAASFTRCCLLSLAFCEALLGFIDDIEV